MVEIAKMFADFTPGAAGIWTLVAMMGLYLIREWRETRKLSADDRLARREGYAKQVENLQGENRKLRSDLADVETRHADYRRLCHAETDQLRDQVVNLENRMSGLLRKLADIAVRAARGEIDSNIAAAILQLAAEAAGTVPTGPAQSISNLGGSNARTD